MATLGQIEFTNSRDTKQEILTLFDKAIDEEGFIVEKDNPTRRVLTPSGEEIHIDEWVGFDKGSLAFIRGSAHEVLRIAKKNY